mmetsp:Transcript_10847/g.31359  ORF Transcript_10847/g.31359 Transcript_10847/m.31359 type:complete len:238 (-) Transcript_10847:93-806(-)
MSGGKQVSFTTEGHDGQQHHADLLFLEQRFHEACMIALQSIEGRQAAIDVRLQSVVKQREDLHLDREELDREAETLDLQQRDLDEKLASLASQRATVASAKPKQCRDWFCCAKPDRGSEFVQDQTIARVDAVSTLKVYGAGSEDVNGSYIKTQDCNGDTYFFKTDEGPSGKALYFSDGQKYGMPAAWYLADNYRGLGIYQCLHEQEETLPFAGWEIFDVEDFSNPGYYPPPLVEVES